jgi:hypothetical protein
MADDSERSVLKEAERLLPWLAALFSSIAAIAGIFAAFDAHTQTRLAAEQAEREARVALVRYCDVTLRTDMHPGDDIFYLTGASGDFDYTALAEALDFTSAFPKKITRALRCQFTNYSRVPLLRITFFFNGGFHHDHKVKQEHNDFPFPALESNKTRTVWFVNTDNEPVVVHEPMSVRYIRFPRLTELYDEKLASVADDSWTLTRDHNPQEHLGDARP